MTTVNKEKIKNLRAEYSKLGQVDSAKNLNVSQYVITSLESGKNINPRLFTIANFLLHYKISFFEFVDTDTSQKMLAQFTQKLVDDNVFDMATAAKIHKYFKP